MPLLSNWARRKKCAFFIDPLPKHWRVLEVGAGDGWVGNYMRRGGWDGYVGLDLRGEADVGGDVRDWQELGLAAGSFDAIVAFEVVEHVDCFEAMHALLKPGGVLMLTSPHPKTDWLCACFEWVGLAQKRSSPHTHLVDFRRIPLFEVVEIRRVGFLSQWGTFKKL